MSVDSDNFYNLINKIQQEYPAAMPLLQQPGVLQVYMQAVGENWSPDRVEAALESTEWWKNTPQATRQWQALSATDPATAADKQAQVRKQFDDIQAQTGVHLSQVGGLASPYVQLFHQAVVEGWDANRIKYEIIGHEYGSKVGGGEVGANAAQVKSMANDYGVSLSDMAVVQWANQLAQSAVTPDAVKGYLIEQAKSRFPGLSDALDRGVTVRQYADQYLQILNQETGANTAAMSMTDPKIMAALDQVDPKTGQHYSMSMTDWTKKVRTDSAYGYDTSQQAHAQVATLATQVAQKMGAI